MVISGTLASSSRTAGWHQRKTYCLVQRWGSRKLSQGVMCLVAQSCLTLCNPWTACQAPLSMEILQARILEWVAYPFSRGSSQPRNQTRVSLIVGRFFTSWAISIFPEVLTWNIHQNESQKENRETSEMCNQALLSVPWTREKWWQEYQWAECALQRSQLEKPTHPHTSGLGPRVRGETETVHRQKSSHRKPAIGPDNQRPPAG